jgi:hypothetical protein
MPTRYGGRARAVSTTLIGTPLWYEATLHASTARLIDDSVPSSAARARYSAEGLPRPEGL